MSAAPVTGGYRLRETSHLYGSGLRLYGVLTHPAEADPARPVVVIPNTGLEHRVGPHRLHVQIARALAAAGYWVFRFDIAGLGDSDGPLDRAASPIDDIRETLDFLQGRDLGGRFANVGVCSGSHDGHQAARDDDRIIGLFSIDGYAFRNARFRRLLWGTRFQHPVRSARNILGRAVTRLQLVEPQGAQTEVIHWPPEEEVAADYAAFTARGLSQAFVFTGGVQSLYLYADQHYDVFPQLRGVAPVWFLPHLDHMLSRRAAREETIGHLLGWLDGLRSPADAP